MINQQYQKFLKIRKRLDYNIIRKHLGLMNYKNNQCWLNIVVNYDSTFVLSTDSNTVHNFLLYPRNIKGGSSALIKTACSKHLLLKLSMRKFLQHSHKWWIPKVGFP